MGKILKLPKDSIENVLKRGRVISSPLFSIKYLENPLKIARFTIVVSKKEEKTAVRRNLIKRRLREIVRKILKSKSFKGDFVIFPKKGVLVMAHDNLAKFVEESFKIFE